jgi:tol-pal system protein YbgF
MQYISKALVAGGLVILTGPLCLMGHAQSYVDVEAERAAAQSSAASDTSTSGDSGTTAPPDPYSVQPAQSYPATSYGVGSAPAATPMGGTTAPGAAPAAAQGGQNLGNLFYQLQQLQQEVMRLNGKVEEQANELRVLKEQSLQRYVDLDKRISGGAGAAAGSAASASASSGGSGNTTITMPPASSGSGVAEQPGEGEAYRAAYALVRGQQFDSAVQAFQKFLQDYPAGKYAPNAHYWLGELYLVVDPQDLESSRQAFMLLLSEYPGNSKAPDAMYKLGKVYFLKGNREKSREYMDRVISDYGSSNSSAVKLARDFIAENY